MRILLHDFSGHPFQSQLSRGLAARGHEVLHIECSSYPSGKGSFDGSRGDGQPTFASISLGRPFERYHPLRRLVDELRYSIKFIAACRRFGPDIVISCNDPLLAKAVFGLWAAVRRVRWVFWLQDIYSVAMTREADRRSWLGPRAGRLFQWIERRLLHSADAVVPISEDFSGILDEWGIDEAKRTVIENWAPIEELPVRPRDNPWRTEQGLGDRFVYLYAGTLGLKHNPELLATLAEAQPETAVVVVSEGLGADHLREQRRLRSIENLHVLDYQPWESVPDVTGTADVLIVLLEPDAGVYSVPSKILTSLCAGRPILASIPAANLGARTITDAGAGIVVTPGEEIAFKDAARRLLDTDERKRMGMSARSFAEKTFDIERITDRFAAVIERASRNGTGRS